MATQTAYAACSADNFIGPVLSNGETINNAFNNGPGPATTFTWANAATAYDYCVACQTSGTCQSSLSLQGDGCFLVYKSDNQCPAQGVRGGWFTSTQNPGYAFTISNGPCGYAYYADEEGRVRSLS